MLNSMAVDDPARPITDEDRRAAVTTLRQAAEDGRLGPQDLDRRLAQVDQARLAGELGAALAGIPPARSTTWPTTATPQGQPAAPPPQPPITPQLPQPAGYRPDDRLTLSGVWSDEKRRGEWTIPPYLRLQAGLSNVKLDCRQATPDSPIIDIEVGMGVGNTVLILPEGWGVNTDRLRKGMGTIKIKVPTAATPGNPTLVLHGQLGAGTIVVRHENWFERRTKPKG